jgi:hypothetical protein
MIPLSGTMIRAAWYTLCDRSGKDWNLLIFD